MQETRVRIQIRFQNRNTYFKNLTKTVHEKEWQKETKRERDRNVKATAAYRCQGDYKYGR